MNKGKLEMSICYQALKSTSQEHMRGHFHSLSASLAWQSPRVDFLSSHIALAPAAGPLRTPPRAPNSLCQGRPWWKALPNAPPHVHCYLVLEFPILKESQLILTVQIIPINVAEVYLRTERQSTQVIMRSCKCQVRPREALSPS